MDPDQTAPIGAVWSESTLFIGMASKTFQQTTKAVEFCCDYCRFKGYSCKTTEPQTTKATSFIRIVCPVNVRRKLKSYLFTDTLVCTCAHWNL